MDSSSSKTHSLSSLLVFNNTINPELIRSLHVYRLVNGKEREVEREFVFKGNGQYVELEAQPLQRSLNFGLEISSISEGLVNGLWVCVFAFHSSSHISADDNPTCNIPSFLTLSRNPKLKSIPSLANDLETVFRLIGTTETTVKEPRKVPPQRTCQSMRNNPALDQDLNCLPYSVSMPNDQNPSGTVEEKKKKKRAASKDIARIALSDLAKYFDLPIVEASRNLKVGLTVLKKKCREFGIPRWPHRKIKSLDGLIRDLQEERKRQEEEEAETAIAKRQMMLENEKESIEKRPFLEMKSETKRFRQDVFKRRHRARVLSSAAQPQSSSLSSSLLSSSSSSSSLSISSK